MQSVLLAVGLLRNRETEDYVYLFNEMRKTVGNSTWSIINAVCSDGEKAMIAALRKTFCEENVLLQRCAFHLRKKRGQTSS